MVIAFRTGMKSSLHTTLIPISDVSLMIANLSFTFDWLWYDTVNMCDNIM